MNRQCDCHFDNTWASHYNKITTFIFRTPRAPYNRAYRRTSNSWISFGRKHEGMPGHSRLWMSTRCYNQIIMKEPLRCCRPDPWPQPVLPLEPKYQLGHPENYLFWLSIKICFGSRYPKKIWKQRHWSQMLLQFFRPMNCKIQILVVQTTEIQQLMIYVRFSRIVFLVPLLPL